MGAVGYRCFSLQTVNAKLLGDSTGRCWLIYVIASGGDVKQCSRGNGGEVLFVVSFFPELNIFLSSLDRPLTQLLKFSWLLVNNASNAKESNQRCEFVSEFNTREQPTLHLSFKFYFPHNRHFRLKRLFTYTCWCAHYKNDLNSSGSPPRSLSLRFRSSSGRVLNGAPRDGYKCVRLKPGFNPSPERGGKEVLRIKEELRFVYRRGVGRGERRRFLYGRQSATDSDAAKINQTMHVAGFSSKPRVQFRSSVASFPLPQHTLRFFINLTN